MCMYLHEFMCELEPLGAGRGGPLELEFEKSTVGAGNQTWVPAGAEAPFTAEPAHTVPRGLDCLTLCSLSLIKSEGILEILLSLKSFKEILINFVKNFHRSKQKNWIQIEWRSRNCLKAHNDAERAVDLKLFEMGAGEMAQQVRVPAAQASCPSWSHSCWEKESTSSKALPPPHVP